MDHGATTASPPKDPNAALEDAKVFFLFPTCLWQHDLKPDDAAAIKATILPKIEQLLAPREETMRDQVWQTHHDLHKLEEFSGLLGFVDLAADGVLKFLQIDYKDIEVTGCWANVNPSGTDHHPHIHPNNFLSGVYYAQVPRGDDGLFLYDPRPQTSIISPQVRKVTDYTCNTKMLPIKEGRMFIFPAWLQHSVQTTGGEGERVSISFNVMFSSFTKDYSPPRWKRRPSVPED